QGTKKPLLALRAKAASPERQGNTEPLAIAKDVDDDAITDQVALADVLIEISRIHFLELQVIDPQDDVAGANPGRHGLRVDLVALAKGQLVRRQTQRRPLRGRQVLAEYWQRRN